MSHVCSNSNTLVASRSCVHAHRTYSAHTNACRWFMSMYQKPPPRCTWSSRLIACMSTPMHPSCRNTCSSLIHTSIRNMSWHMVINSGKDSLAYDQKWPSSAYWRCIAVANVQVYTRHFVLSGGKWDTALPSPVILRMKLSCW